VRIGNASVTVVEGQVEYSFPSDGRVKKNIKENVPGTDFINKLRPVTYTMDSDRHEELTGFKCVDTDTVKSGFIAQEVKEASEQIGYDFNGVNTPKEGEKLYTMSYDLLVPSLVKALQECIQKIERQEQDIKKLMDGRS